MRKTILSGLALAVGTAALAVVADAQRDLRPRDDLVPGRELREGVIDLRPIDDLVPPREPVGGSVEVQPPEILEVLAEGDVLTINGLGFYAPVAVRLGRNDLGVVQSSSTEITAELPDLSPGSYRLEVTAAGAADTFDLALGAVGPQGERGPPGPSGLEGYEVVYVWEHAPEARADCPPGKIAIAGGSYNPDIDTRLRHAYPRTPGEPYGIGRLPASETFPAGERGREAVAWYVEVDNSRSTGAFVICVNDPG